jgi:hypothetical protein
MSLSRLAEIAAPRYLFAGSLRRIAELRPLPAGSRIAVKRLIVFASI